MSPLRSLRSRLVVGALLWTVGIMAVVSLASPFVVRHLGGIPRLVHYTLLSMVAVGLILAALSQVGSGLSPLRRLRERLARVREGRDARVDGSYPSEVQPLVDDLNALLEDRERRVARALARAGDLAHGLKTPLAVLAQEARRAEALGQHEIAATLDEQVERMTRQMDYQLARARAASGAAAAARCPVAESAAALARTLRRLYAERGLAIEVEVPAGLVARVAREDLDEMLGNLLDNACKWARSRVTVTARRGGRGLVVSVEDDGPGLDPSLRDAVLQRGVRADQAAPGTGFGLAIVRELAELYGGSVALDASTPGGLRAELELPAAG